MSKFTGLSLFSGIGGMDLAFNWAGGSILAFCEVEPFCQKVLRKHWPDIPIFADIHNLNKEALFSAGIHTAVDVIYGGFPCQPFSVAGNQKGKDDSRYLWPEFSRLVGELKPRWVVAENVPGILSIAADTVCSDLERQGYEVGIWSYEAAAVGAKHRRERIFFVAHAGRALLQRSEQPGELRTQAEGRITAEPERPSSSYVPDTDKIRCDMRRFERQGIHGQKSALNEADTGCEIIVSPQCQQHGGMWESEPCVDRVVNGLPNRVDRLKALGNAVVPQQVYPIFQAIFDADERIDV